MWLSQGMPHSAMAVVSLTSSQEDLAASAATGRQLLPPGTKARSCVPPGHLHKAPSLALLSVHLAILSIALQGVAHLHVGLLTYRPFLRISLGQNSGTT